MNRRDFLSGIGKAAAGAAALAGGVAGIARAAAEVDGGLPFAIPDPAFPPGARCGQVLTWVSNDGGWTWVYPPDHPMS